MFQVPPSDPEFHGRRGTATGWDILTHFERRNRKELRRNQSEIQPTKVTKTGQRSLYYQPKQCTIILEFPQDYHTFVLFDPPKKSSTINLMVLNLKPSYRFILSIQDESRLAKLVYWTSTGLLIGL